MTKFLFVAGSIAVLASCSPNQQRGAAYGALGGAAIGAVAGDRHDALRGAALGAAVGTGIGALTDEENRRREAEAGYGQQGTYEQTAPPERSRPATGPGNYPFAEKTANPDQVISPYSPYNVIDVAGFRSGQLARDPSNQKIFRIP